MLGGVDVVQGVVGEVVGDVAEQEGGPEGAEEQPVCDNEDS